MGHLPVPEGRKLLFPAPGKVRRDKGSALLPRFYYNNRISEALMIRLRMGKFMAAGGFPGRTPRGCRRFPPWHGNFVIFPWVADVYPAAQDCVGGLSTLDGASVA